MRATVVRRAISTLAVGLSLVCWKAQAQQHEVSIPVTRDTTIFAHDPTLSDGAGTGLFCGFNSQRSPRRVLLHFDVAASLPVGVTITKAVLKLQLTRSQLSSTTVSVHRVTAAWGEGESRSTSGGGGGGSPAASRDATWSHRYWPDQTWGEPGGDYVAQVSAATDVGELGAYAWSSEALARDAQHFLDAPEDNFGWILVGESPARAVAKRFSSREESQGSGPQLVLTYAPPPAPSGACCFADGRCGIRLDPGTSCDGTYLGAGSVCQPGVCPEPTGACCLLDAKATCEVRTKSECAAGAFRGGASSCEPNPCPVVLTPFVDPLPLPSVAMPTVGAKGDEATYHMSMVQTQQRLHRDLPPTTVWGFSDGTSTSYPGPTLEARAGRAVSVVWANDLRDQAGHALDKHPLSVDHCLHGAADDSPRTVIHLHGGHVPSDSDGQPDATLLPGAEVRYQYPNIQRAATLWYHDHAVGITRLNVYMGLAGFYLLRDEEEAALPLPSGEYEIPLAIQDRTFYPDGRLRYPDAWQDSFFGEHALVNGKVTPYLNVKRGLYRFRMLNGSTSRAYTLSLSDGRSFLQIGNDGGLLPESISVRALTITPGERADVVIDFRHAGSEVLLKNSARSPYPGGGSDAAPLENILGFVVGTELGYTTPVPVKLATVAALAESDAVMTRDLTLAPGATDHCGATPWLINGLDWHDITERPLLGTSEIWRFVNRSGLTHPMHMHAVFFQVLDRQSHKLVDGELQPQGPAQPPRRNELAWKDTVQVGPLEAVRVIARFEDFAGRFPYHCHLLEHEDHGMMRQFEIQAPCGDGVVTPEVEECDDGNENNHDGCSSLCRQESAGSVESDTNAARADNGADAAGCRLGVDRERSPGLAWVWLMVAALALRRVLAFTPARSGCVRAWCWRLAFRPLSRVRTSRSSKSARRWRRARD